MLEVYIITNDRITVQHPIKPARHYEFTRWWTMARFKDVLNVSYQVVTNWKLRGKIAVTEINIEHLGIKVNLVDTAFSDLLDDCHRKTIQKEINTCLVTKRLNGIAQISNICLATKQAENNQ